jgi:hypothetical protein
MHPRRQGLCFVRFFQMILIGQVEDICFNYLFLEPSAFDALENFLLGSDLKKKTDTKEEEEEDRMKLMINGSSSHNYVQIL